MTEAIQGQASATGTFARQVRATLREYHPESLSADDVASVLNLTADGYIRVVHMLHMLGQSGVIEVVRVPTDSGSFVQYRDAPLDGEG